MNLIPLFFICVKMFHFIHAQQLAFFLHNVKALLQARRTEPKRKHVVIVDNTSLLYIVYFVCDVLFMFYCIYLMLDDATWAPGCMLLIISAMESFAMRARIDGTYQIDDEGYIFPRMWFRYLMFGMSMFILLKLFEG